MSENGFFSDGKSAKKTRAEFERLAESLQKIKEQLRNSGSFNERDLQTLKRLTEKIEEIDRRISSLERGIGELEARLTR